MSEPTRSQRDVFGAPAPLVRRDPELDYRDAAGEPATARIRERVTVGTAPDVDIVLSDKEVSRLHAELDPRDDGLWVRDLGSRNGTYIDKIRVLAARIPHNAKLQVGRTEFVVRYAERPTAVELWPEARFGALVGTSTVMRELFLRLDRVAKSAFTVLIEGETGTGKELVARAIHDASPRARGPFVVIDCGALPENLLEAELFGHARGAFTGAVSARDGAILEADGGTVFLDEIGELPLAMQPKLLRVLESRTVRRLGEAQARSVDVRFISATHRDLRTMANSRAFREDLYFRLAVLPIRIPPLRDRPEDIPSLVELFLPGGSSATVTPELMRELLGRPWFGNVRELRNFLERAATLGAREALAFGSANAPKGPVGWVTGLPEDFFQRRFADFRERVAFDAEREYLRRLLDRHAGKISEAAEAVGINRTYLHRLIKKYGL
jgi:DNA-binding NtrC family response regulator